MGLITSVRADDELHAGIRIPHQRDHGRESRDSRGNIAVNGNVTRNHLPDGRDLASLAPPGAFSETRCDGIGFD
jgi:hypothetical protein